MLDHPVRQSDYLEVCGKNADLQIQNRDLRERKARLESDLEDMRASMRAQLEIIDELRRENDQLQKMLFAIVEGLEPCDSRDDDSDTCILCYAGFREPHRETCAYVRGLGYSKKMRPDLWEGDI